MKKIIITELDEKLVTAVHNGKRITDINFESAGQFHIDDIYTGRVESIAKNINAAFIEIADGIKCFYQLKKDEKLKVGDELPVQITRDAVKTKDAECSIRLSIPGKYVVVTEGLYSLGISSKIPDGERKFELQQLFDSTFSYDDSYSFIIRTNAAEADNEQILSEAEGFISELKRIRETALHQVPFKKLYSGSSYYRDAIRDSHEEFEVVTDIPEIYEELSACDDMFKVSLYDDKLLPLAKLYKIETEINDAMSKKVWLKSGGYLVIEGTEALNVIDVNTGKNDAKKDTEATFLKTNLEAAAEAAAQIRLRNLSGIIIIDFIDMKKRENLDDVIGELKRSIYNDPVKVNFVDVTKLNLVELTRKKVYKSLKEQLADD